MPLSQAALNVAAAASSSTVWNRPPRGPPPKPSSVTSTRPPCSRFVRIPFSFLSPWWRLSNELTHRKPCTHPTAVLPCKAVLSIKAPWLDVNHHEQRYLVSPPGPVFPPDRSPWGLSPLTRDLSPLAAADCRG